MPGSSFDDILIINPSQVSCATSEQVAQAQTELGVQLPVEYRTYVQRLGAGALGHFVRIELPAELSRLSAEWRERVTEYWFWDTASAGVNHESLQQRGILLGSSFDGDELCLDPVDQESLIVLPRNEDVAHRIDAGFLAAVDWMLSGTLNPWVEGWTFEALARRAEMRRDFPSGPQLTEAVQTLSALGEHVHMVDLADRTTFFLPQIGGRLSLYQFEGEPLTMDFTYDQDANAEVVQRIAAAVGG